MIRKITCVNCKEGFEIKSSANSRHELENERGRYFSAKCNICHIDNEYHVNAVKASPGGTNLILYISLGIALFLMITVYLFKMGFVGTISLAVPAFVYLRLKQNSEKSVQLFNRGEISRTRPA